MKNFAIIGIAGFVAKKHLNCIKKLNGNLVAAFDIHDNVGFIDNYYPKTKFFKNEKEFFLFLNKKKVDYLVVCSPTYLHYRHIIKGLESKVNIIVEKPPILKKNNLKQIYFLEKKFNKKCYCIFQLRVNKKIIGLKKKIEKQKKNFFNVEIFYNTFRGNWYFKSWKNDNKLSGGLAVNIGIHFFDILLWFFGSIKKFHLKKNTKLESIGEIYFNNAKAKWFLSTNKISNKSYKNSFDRYLKLDGKKYNFDKFNDLHLTNYKEIIKGNFHISEFEKIIKFLSLLK